MKKTLLMGPRPPAYTGQSIAFDAIATYMRERVPCTIIDISNADNLAAAVRLYFRISYYMIFYRYNVVYFTCSRSLFGSFKDVILIFWARLTRTRVVNHLHGADFKTFYHRLPPVYKWLIKWSYDYIDTSIVLIHGMQQQFSDFQNMKIEVIANAYPRDLDLCPSYKPINSGKPIQLLYLSNLMVSKGIMNLLKAMEFLFPRYPHLNLKIAGKIFPDHLASQKKTEEEFYRLYHQLKLRYRHQIEYLGVCFGEQKRKLLWESDVVILPTFYPMEALPISILEGMRTGNVIITCRHNYLAHIVSKANGLLIEPNDVPAIINSIAYVCDHREEMILMQQHNIDHAKKLYSEDSYVKNLWFTLMK